MQARDYPPRFAAAVIIASAFVFIATPSSQY
jgi:hypothetical protein